MSVIKLHPLSADLSAVTMDELRAAWDRCRVLRLDGWTFERALSTPIVAWSLMRSAASHRITHHLPAQPRLI